MEMQAQLRLRWLTRRACVPGVLSSRQVGMTAHALQQLDALAVTAAATSATNILPAVQELCAEADGRSQANMLHALACATGAQCTPRVTLDNDLSRTLKVLQEQLVETADSLTAPETILVMEALLKLAPFAGDDGAVVHQRLLDEVQERSMALASVVERAVDLLGVTRVTVEAATSAAVTAPSSALSTQSLTSVSTAAWANDTLEHVLRVVQARLATFSDQELLALVDALTVRRALVGKDAESGHVEALISEEAREQRGASSSSPPPSPSSLPESAEQRVVFLDQARFLLNDVLDRALESVDSLSVSQLSAWCARLVGLRLTDHALLPQVVKALASADRNDAAFTVAQLSSTVKTLSTLLHVVLSAPHLNSTTELYVKAYAQLLSQLVGVLHQRRRADPTVLAEAQTYLLPLLLRVPEVELNAYLQEAGNVDSRFSVPMAGVAAATTSGQVRVFMVLSAAVEKAAAVLLRLYAALPPRDQAQVASFAFHWRVYMPRATGSEVSHSRAPLDDGDEMEAGVPTTFPKAVEMMERCRALSAADAARKHHAVCELVKISVDDFNVKDTIQVLNEVVTVHYAWDKKKFVASSRQGSATSATTTSPDNSATQTADKVRVMAEAAAEERRELAMRLLARLQGPLQGQLKEVHTAQLVRYLSSMSKLNVRTKAPYNAVLLALKGRSLTTFEQISVLGVLARHHLRSPYVLYGIVRELPRLGQSLHVSQKALLLKYLGQAGAQRLVKAPCAEGLTMGTFFASAGELAQLPTMGLVFSFNGLVALRQYDNPATTAVLAEMVSRLPSHDASSAHVGRAGLFRSIQSSTTLAELVASLCRYGGPSQGVPPSLVAEAIYACRARITASRSLFVDVSQLTWCWPCVEQYADPSSAIWADVTQTTSREVHDGGRGGAKANKGATPAAISAEDVAQLSQAFAELRSTVQKLLRQKLLSIATASDLRRNTFLWNQLGCGVHFDALPSQGSDEMIRLWAHLDREELAPLLLNPQQLLDATTLALSPLPQNASESTAMLAFVKKHMASLRVQDALQIWWYASRQLSSSKKATFVGNEQHALLLSVRDAAKEHVLHEEKAAMGKLSATEHVLLQLLT